MAAPELRVDPLSGHRSAVVPERADRPGGGFHVAPLTPLDPAADPFLEGHEDQTPPEVDADRPAGGPADGPGWRTRVVPNRWPVLLPDAPNPEPEARPELFQSAAARGVHEVIVNAPGPEQTLGELQPAQLQAVLEMWRRRLRAHAGAPYAHLFVNERLEAGASLPHTHAQLLALPSVPQRVARERERYAAYAVQSSGQDLVSDLVQEEVRRRVRLVAYDDDAVLLAPWAARMPYHLQLFPRRARMRFEDDGATGAALLHDALGRLARRFGAPPPLTLFVRTAPAGAEHFCWRIELLPRLSGLGGIELGAGIDVTTVAPEQAAAELRDA